MLDFSAALYLGFRHPASSLGAWTALTSGRPAVLAQPPLVHRVAADLSELVGAESSLLSPSTLHAFWDLYTTIGNRETNVLLDASAYPVSRWGVHRAARSGGRILRFAHHDPMQVKELLARGGRGRWALVTDGYCPDCGRVAPLGAYVTLLEARGGLLIVDDTQALGVLGRRPGRDSPYGDGGGGSLAFHGLEPGPSVVTVSSLSKGFGVPIAVTSAWPELIGAVARAGVTRVHSSPPSMPHLLAARRAAMRNRRIGDRARRRLANLVDRLRGGLAGLGLRLVDTMFPVQVLPVRDAVTARALHDRLQTRGVRIVPIQRRCRRGFALAVIVTAAHDLSDVAGLVTAVSDVMDRRAVGRSA